MKDKIESILNSDGINDPSKDFVRTGLLNLSPLEWEELHSTWKTKPRNWQENPADSLEPVNDSAIRLLENMVRCYFPDVTWKAAETLLYWEKYQLNPTLYPVLRHYLDQEETDDSAKEIYDALLKK